MAHHCLCKDLLLASGARENAWGQGPPNALGKMARWLPSVVRLRGCVRKVIAVGPRGGQHNLTNLLESVASNRLRFLGRLTKNAPRQILSWDLHLPVTGRCRSNLRFGLGYPARSLSQPWSACRLKGRRWPRAPPPQTLTWTRPCLSQTGTSPRLTFVCSQWGPRCPPGSPKNQLD